MLSRTLTFLILAGLFASTSVSAQTCGNTTLSCLIPTALHTGSSTFNFLNEALGTQIGEVPLATPASGFIYSFDKALGVPVLSQQSFGPLLAERAETIGKQTAYLAFTYQRYSFSVIDGNNLKNLPILFYFPNQQNPTVVTYTQNRVDVNLNQYVIYGTFGITDRIDVSFAVPLARVALGVSSKGTEYSTSTPATASFTEYLPGSASGIGDVILAAKGTVHRSDKFDLAAGAELRFPSGDAKNFLGAGAYGFKPYLVLSRAADRSTKLDWGKIAPHLNVAYQWNGTSVLATDANGTEGNLPSYFGYAAGAELAFTRRITVVADLVGREYFGAAQVSTPRTIMAPVDRQQTPFSSIVQVNGSYNVNNLAIGLKANPWNRILLMANVTFKLNDAGLRATAVPFVGASYTFDYHPHR